MNDSRKLPAASLGAWLSEQKVAAELAKLELEIEHSRQANFLAREKLQLENRELRRSAWLKPGTFIPILATLGTIGFAGYNGVFETASKKNQNELDRIALETREVQFRRTLLEQDVAKLDIQRTALAKENQAALAARDKALSELHAATASLGVARQQLKDTYPAFKSQVLVTVAGQLSRCAQHMSAPQIPTLLANPKGAAAVAIDLNFIGSVEACLKEKMRGAANVSKLSSEDQATVGAAFAKLLADLASESSEARRALGDRKYRSSFEYLNQAEALGNGDLWHFDMPQLSREDEAIVRDAVRRLRVQGLLLESLLAKIAAITKT